MRPYFGEHFGNASSIHHHGQETRAAVENARESVAQLLGCSAAEIIFTSGGTESDNLAMAGLVEAGDHVITSALSITRCCMPQSIWKAWTAKLRCCQSMAAAW